LELIEIGSNKNLKKEKQKNSHFMKQKNEKYWKEYNYLIKKNKKYIKDYKREFNNEIVTKHYNVLEIKIISIKKKNQLKIYH